jgi:glutaredoxin-like YruB-family protein
MAQLLINQEKKRIMLKQITDLNNLVSELAEDQKNYLLLYKSGSESSDCAYANLTEASKKLPDVNIMCADVNQVRDIHPHYGISSVPSLLVFEGKQHINVVKGCNDPPYYIGLFEESLFHAAAKIAGKTMKSVTVYTTPSCSWCNTLKTYLRSNHIPYREIDVSRDQQAAAEMVRRSGQQGVPQTSIDGQIVVGFDKNRINNLLGIQQSANN